MLGHDELHDAVGGILGCDEVGSFGIVAIEGSPSGTSQPIDDQDGPRAPGIGISRVGIHDTPRIE